jgi:hypothetical protein
MMKVPKDVQAEWEAKLAKSGLTMDAGRHRPRYNKVRKEFLVYIGDTNNLQDLEKEIVRKEVKRVRPSNNGPD